MGALFALGRRNQTPPYGGHRSDGEGKFGEDRLKPGAGLSVVSEFVVVTAQVLNERVPATDHRGAASRFTPRIGRVRAFKRP